MSVPRVLLLGALVASPTAAPAATFTVNATPDLPDTNPGDGVCATASFNCTLHAALQEADATPDLDTIAFSIPGAGVHSIASGVLVPVMHPVVIDGFTQPGAQPNTNPTGGLNAVLKIELTGGLGLRGAGSVARGLVLNGGMFQFGFGTGVPALTVVEGCYVGTDATGTLARGGNPALFFTSAGAVRVGGTMPAQRNLISGAGTGVRFLCPINGGSCNPGSVVQGNLIGTTAGGDAPLPNFVGVESSTSGSLTIGGAYNGREHNVISGNTFAGIVIGGNANSGTVVVQGNRIGRNATGTFSIPNGLGIRIVATCAGPPCNSALDGPPVLIGGSAATRNAIHDNVEHGITATTGILDIADNLIIANGGSGIFLETSTPWRLSGQIARNAIDANSVHGISGNTIIGPASVTIRENSARANGADGISLRGGFRARLEGNAILSSISGLGIDLGDDDVTANDFLDQDGGPNDLMNFPDLAGACTTSGNVVVSGSLHTRPNFTATIEFFRSPFCHVSGHGEGSTPIGTASVTTDNMGEASFVAPVGAAIPNEFITATATSAAGETSEFSACIPVTPVPFPPPQAISGPSTVCSGEPFRLNGVTGAGQYQWSRNGTPIPGATLPFYERAAAAPGDAGDYVVSASNGCGVTASSAPHTLAVVSCAASAVRIDVDRHAGTGTVSDLNGVLETAESVLLEPRYLNNGAAAIALTGTAALTGPPPGAYALPDAAADYGTTPPAQLTDCFNATGNCYRAVVDAPSGRPVRHWDALFTEDPSGPDPTRSWRLHVGESFADVPRADAVYRFVETILHRSITAGCSATDYCPSASTLRDQMAVFVLIGKEGPSYRPPDCNPAAPRFTDLPASSPFCRWVEELARRQVVAGCGGSNYCPGTTVSREQMAVFVLATREAPGYAPPACVAGAERFADVPAASPFCRWVEELHRRGVVAGCGNGNFCPGSPITRGEMSVFLTVTFGLQLYGP